MFHFLRFRYSRTPGEISDSSLGDSIFSYQLLQQQKQQQHHNQHILQQDELNKHQQRRYFGSTESCRYIDIPPTSPHCRRCSLDSGGVGIGCPPTTPGSTTKGPGEKCGYSDSCRYDCKNCDCSSSYFSSDFDELYYNNRGEETKNYYNDSQRQQRMDLKQNKYAQDFFKHVNDVKRSIYQTEMMNSYSTIPPPKSSGEPVKSYFNRRQQQNLNPNQHPIVYSTLPLTGKENNCNVIYATTTVTTTSLTTTTTTTEAVGTTSTTMTTTTSPALQRSNKSMTGAIPKSNNSNNTSSSSLSHQSQSNVLPKSPKPEKIKNLKSKLVSSNSSLSSIGGGSTTQATPTGKRKQIPTKAATEDDDVFYDARSEDSASTATTTNTQNTVSLF